LIFITLFASWGALSLAVAAAAIGFDVSGLASLVVEAVLRNG